MKKLGGAFVLVLCIVGQALAIPFPTRPMYTGTATITSSGPLPTMDTYVSCDATNGAVTISLPPTKGVGDWVIIEKIDSSGNACSISAAGSDTIDGSTSISTQFGTLALYDRGLGFWGGIAASSGGTITGNTLAAHNFANSINSSGVISGARPACADLSDSSASCATDATNASNISSGTLNAARMPLGLTSAPSSGQIPIGNAGGTAYAKQSITGDASLSSAGAITVSKTNGSAFATSATTDTTNANNITSGTLAAARGGAGTVSGALKGNGAGVVSQAACADLSDSSASCSTDATNAGNISSGTLPTARMPLGLTSAPASGRIPIGNGTTYANQPISGDATLSSSGALTVTKTNGSNFAASATTDTTNASNISSGSMTRPIAISLANANPGTSANLIAISTTSGGSPAVTTAATSTTQGVLGICINGCGNTGTATIQQSGLANCVFDGGVTLNDYVTLSTSVAGDCHDEGNAQTPGILTIGSVVNVTNASAGTYQIQVGLPTDAVGAGATGITSGASVGNPAYYSATGTVNFVTREIHLNSSNAGHGKTYPTIDAAFWQNGCGSNQACRVIIDPNFVMPNPSPTWVGGPTTGSQYSQTLVIRGAINNTDTTAGNLDDGIVEASSGQIFCDGNGSSTNFTGIETAGTAVLNAVLTAPGGVIENSWQSAHTYLVGQVIADSNGNTEQVQAINGVFGSDASGTSGGTTPTWPNSLNGTVTDGSGSTQITWRQISSGKRVGAYSGTRFWEEGCNISGSTSASGSQNSVLHVSGVDGGLATIKQGSIGSINSLGTASTTWEGFGTGIMVDDGEDKTAHGMCTGTAGSPFACCASPASSSTCQSGAGGVEVNVEFDQIFLAPGQGTSGGPSYGIHLTSQINSLWNFQWHGGQIADLNGSTNNIALFQVDGGATKGVSVDGAYWEFGSGTSQQSTGSGIIINNAQDVNITNGVFQPNNNSIQLTNMVLISGGTTNPTHVHIQGRYLGSGSGGGSFVNAINNTAETNTQTISGTTTSSLDYNYTSTGSASHFTFDGAAPLSLAGWLTSKLGGNPGAPGAASCIMSVVAGTNAGSCKLQATCGTSGTPVTIIDNVGSGC